MRLRDREAFLRKQNGIVTVSDMRRALKAESAAERKAMERRQRAAKDATKGQALPGLEVGQ